MRTRHQTNSGFSLLELSISLVIIGLVTASFLGYMRISQQKQVMTTTQNSLKSVNEAVEVYLEWNKKLPCPAPLSAAQDDPKKGHALDCEAILQGGVFTSKDYVLTHAKDDDSRHIIIGRVPYNDLNIPYKDTLDGWGRDMFFAMSLSLTDVREYSQQGGVIEVIDQFDKEVTKADSKAQYLIWSAAANNTGTLTDNCHLNKGPEAENCDEDGTFRTMPRSYGSVYFDDILSYSVFVKRPQIVDENCDLIEHLEFSIPNIMDIIQNEDLDTDAFYIRPGEIVTVCNKSILNRLKEKQCVSFVCRSDNTLRSVNIIR